MNRRQKKKYGLSQKEKDERLKREWLKHFPEIYSRSAYFILQLKKLLQHGTKGGKNNDGKHE